MDKTGVPKIGSTIGRLIKRSIVAAVVIDREHNKTLTSENADHPFHAGSLVKLLIAVDALKRHPDDDAVATRVGKMIRMSDDPTASSFWVSEGGPAIISRMVREMDLKQTRPPVPSSQWGETMVSANDLVRIYDYIMTEIPDPHRTTIVNAMAEASPRGSDGFDQTYGIPTGLAHLDWAVKQAWTNNDTTMSCHSTGFVGPNFRYTVIVLTENPRGTPWSLATQAVTEAMKNVAPLVTS